MQVFPIRTRLIKVGEDFLPIIIRALRRQKLSLRNGDILAVSGKVIATSEGRVVSLREVIASSKARQLAAQHHGDPAFMEVVLSEADDVYGGVPHALLTLKRGILIANAGVDRTNAPPNYVALWPSSPQRTANKVRRQIQQLTRKNVGVLITDSRTTPLRMGSIGLALAAAGFETVEDLRGRGDLYGRPLKVTRVAVADGLAGVANLHMGEAEGRTPAVLIRGAPVRLGEGYNPARMRISPKRCLFMKILRDSMRKSKSR